MVRRGIPGGYRLVEWLERSQCLQRTAWYSLSDRISVEMPLWRRPNQLDLHEALNYEHALVDAVAREVAAAALPAVLVDCGADVGLLSGLFAARCPAIDEIITCEPNDEAFAILARNAARWPITSRALHIALADFSGRGALRQPDYDASPHAAFLEADAGGSIDVARVDDLAIDVAARCVAIKVDVEGGELAVLTGAIGTLRRARRWVVTIEAHRKVCERTGADPMQTARLLAPLGLERLYIAERPDIHLDWERPYFAQVEDLEIANLVAASR